MAGIKKYNIGGYGSGFSDPSSLGYGNSPYSWGSTTYGPNIVGTPLDQQYNQYTSYTANKRIEDAENWYDKTIDEYYDTVPDALKKQRTQETLSGGAKLLNDWRQLPKGNFGDKWRDYKAGFQMTPADPSAGMTSASAQMSYSPEMVAEMKELGTLPADAQYIQGAKAPWSIAGQKAATWSMGTQVGKVGASMAPYAAPAYILGKGFEMWADDEKPETATFGEKAASGFTGAASGAAIGTMILPGIGTVAGAIIGAVSGWVRKKKQAKEYQEYLDEVDQYKKDLAQYEESRKQYKDATTLYGTAPIMKRYYDTGGYTNNTKLLSYEE